MVERKTVVASTAYVSLILGYLSLYETGIINPLNKYVFLDYTLAQWIFMILVVLGLGFVIGEILVSGNIKDTLKSTAKYFSQISDMKEGESEQFVKDVLGQTKSKMKEDVFGDKEIPGLAQLNQAVSAVTGKQVSITKQEIKRKLFSIKGSMTRRRWFCAIMGIVLAFVAIGCSVYNIYVLLDGTDAIMADFALFHVWLEKISFFAGYGAIGMTLALFCSSIARRKRFALALAISIVAALVMVFYINWLRPDDPWADPNTSAWTTGGVLTTFKIVVSVLVCIVIGSWLLGTVSEAFKLSGLAKLDKDISSAMTTMQVNITKQEVKEKLKSLKVDPKTAKEILSKIPTLWKRFLSRTGLDRLTVMGKLLIAFILIPAGLIITDLVLRIAFHLVLEYSVINFWTVAYVFFPIPVYVSIAKRTKNAHAALYAAVFFVLAITMVNLVFVYADEGIKNSIVFHFLPVIDDTFILSCFVAGIVGILIVNALKYKVFPSLKVFQAFGKESGTEIIVFKKTGAEYLPILIKAIVYPDRIEMLKGDELKTITAKTNLSQYLYGDVLLVAIDDTFEDAVPVPIPQLTADFNYSPELADLVSTTSSFIDTSIARSQEILNRIKDISNSKPEELRDFMKNEFPNFKKKFLDLDIPIESFQRIVKLNLAQRFHKPVLKKVIIKGRQQVAVTAMLDTGAEISLISERLASKIGAKQMSSVSISGIEDGMVNAPLVNVTIIIDGKEAPIEAAVFPIDKQIGKDLLLDRSVYHWAAEQRIGFQGED